MPAFGWILGTCLFSLLLFFINKKNGNDGYKFIDNYIDNCKDVKLIIDDYKNEDSDVKGGIRKSGQDNFFVNQIKFYSTSYKKYFSIEYITGDAGVSYLFTNFISEMKKNEIVTATINMLELADTSYGTIKKPVPIFNFSRDDPDASWKTFAIYQRGSSKISNEIEMKKNYRGNIGVYLSYIKSKEDLKKIFGKAAGK